MRGGVRPNAGNKVGSKLKVPTEMAEARQLVNLNSSALIQKAITLALAKKCNVAVLIKLVDKILPSLNSSDINANVQGNTVSKMDESQLKQMIAIIAARSDDNEIKS